MPFGNQCADLRLGQCTAVDAQLIQLTVEVTPGSSLIGPKLQRITIDHWRTAETDLPGEAAVDIDALITRRIANQHVAPLPHRQRGGAVEFACGAGAGG